MKHTLQVIGLVVFLLLATTLVAAQDAVNPAELELSGTPQEICAAATPAIEPETRTYAQPEQVLEANVDYRAIFCTDAGPIYIDLLEQYTPETVNNFVFLARNNYYNNTIFHRVIEDFMAQAGDPTGTGSGGPGYQFRDEAIGFLVFDRPGLLAMANAGPATNGSQFFITTVPTPHLNYRHTIFGEVLVGQDNVLNIQLRDPSVADAPATTLQAVVIITDPEAVTSDYEAPQQTADADAIVEALSVVGSAGLPPELEEGYEVPTVVATEDVPPLFAENGHEFRVTTAVNNAACSEDFFFDRLAYTVDAFESAEAVKELLANEDFDAVNAEQDFMRADYAAPTSFLYLTEIGEGCVEAGVLTARIYVPRGRYLAMIESTIPQEIVDQINAQFADGDGLTPFLSERLTQIFEVGLTDAYRPLASEDE